MIRVTSLHPLPFIALAFTAPFILYGADATNSTPAAPTPPAPVAVGVPSIKGADVMETKGVVTGLNFKDASALTAEDYQQIRKMEGLKTLFFSHGPDDASIKILAGMPAIESFTTNGMKMTEAGVGTLATFPALNNLTFFHPGPVFTGTGLAPLAALPHLESFSLGGSSKFTDPGLAIVASFPHLKALRIWHTAVTADGLKALLSLKELKSLMLGQQLDMKEHPSLNDDSLAVIAQLTSLEMLTLEEARLSLAALTKLKQLPNLKRLTLKDIDISSSDVDALKQQLPKVDINWNAPTDRRRIDAQFGPLPATSATPPSSPSAK